jgi:hypothetical protein
MKGNPLFLFAVVVVMLAAVAIPLYAHHAFAAEYDSNKPVKLTGTVTKLEWLNPHARFYIDTKDETGKIVNWDFELASPNGLMRRGWTRNSLKPGDVVTVDGFRAKSGLPVGNARSVTLADGKRVFAGSSFEGDANQ